MISKSVYEQMATAGDIVSENVVVTGTAPNRTFILHILYKNGLHVKWNGDKVGFVVVAKGREEEIENV